MKYIATFLILATAIFAEWPKVKQGDFVAGDERLAAPIDVSKPGEITIASFNIRNLGSQQRSLKDFALLVDLVDEADVVVLQEVGLGLFGEEPDKNKKRITVLLAVLRATFGEQWTLLTADEPTGQGAAAELPVLLYRSQAAGYTITAKFDRPVEIGESRDLAVFELMLAKGERKKQLKLGSIHLTPEDPARGNEMVQASAWLVDQGEELAVLAGDFNWGYRARGEANSYRGEKSVRNLHRRKKLFQVFHELSYIGAAKKKKKQLRTNMLFRKYGYFYDQILLSPLAAQRMADRGKLQQDCGMVAFDLRPETKAVQKKWRERALRSLDKYIEKASSFDEALYDKVLRGAERIANDFSTRILSDHRVVWVQLKAW